MERIAVDGLELEVELTGSGDTIVLIHWGLCAAWAEPLLAAPALAERFALLRYHRAGFAGSDAPPTPIDMAGHAAHCARLLARLGIERAHVVGHSSSAVIALQLALDFPDAVRSLTLMETARPVPPTADQALFVREHVAPATALYRAGDAAGAVDAFATGVFGPGYSDALERGIPGARAQAVADADAFFAAELPALQAWEFREAEARRVTQPVLAVVGERTAVTVPPRTALLCSWLPNVERFELPGASHLLHLENAPAMAEALASFCGRYSGVT
jgi:pimeloyl-ACP methyl ester carboxylesterase